MPQDQWKRANDKSRFGGKRRRASVTYTVREGVACFVRPAGWRDWWPYTTKKVSVFPSFAWRKGGLYGFYQDGYEMKVMKRFVVVNQEV